MVQVTVDFRWLSWRLSHENSQRLCYGVTVSVRDQQRTDATKMYGREAIGQVEFDDNRLADMRRGVTGYRVLGTKTVGEWADRQVSDQQTVQRALDRFQASFGRMNPSLTA